jgi:hypothetical protein
MTSWGDAADEMDEVAAAGLRVGFWPEIPFHVCTEQSCQYMTGVHKQVWSVKVRAALGR